MSGRWFLISAKWPLLALDEQRRAFEFRGQAT